MTNAALPADPHPSEGAAASTLSRPSDRPTDSERQPRALGASRLRLGITGHRSNRISREQLGQLTPALVTLMTQIAALAPGVGRLWLCSALADGADQHTARLALDMGWALHAVLPFDDAGCESDCVGESGRRHFRSLVQRASRITRLDGQPVPSDWIYRQLGQAVVEASDLLVAVWDGEPARGPGGTAEVVAEALRRDRPVLHLWSGGGQCVTLLRQRGGAVAPFTAADLRGVLDSLCASHPSHA